MCVSASAGVARDGPAVPLGWLCASTTLATFQRQCPHHDLAQVHAGLREGAAKLTPPEQSAGAGCPETARQKFRADGCPAAAVNSHAPIEERVEGVFSRSFSLSARRASSPARRRFLHVWQRPSPLMLFRSLALVCSKPATPPNFSSSSWPICSAFLPRQAGASGKTSNSRHH